MWDLMSILAMAATAGIAYFCGCFNGSVIVSKYILRDDIRTHGSGNAGLTNFYRTFGGGLTAVVILLDVVKMILAVLAGVLLIRHFPGVTWSEPMDLYAKYWAGLWCLLGHMYPCMFKFKGGKGILSGGTLVLLIDWRMALVAWGLFLLCVVLTRYISLGSCCAAASFPVSTVLFVSRDPIIVVISAFLGGLVVWKHRGNIKRLASGTESKFSFHPKRG